MRPPALRRFRDEWTSGAEPWVAGTEDRISISSREAPRNPGQKGGWQGKAEARSSAPLRLHRCLGPPSLSWCRFQPRPFCSLEEVHVSFSEEGAPLAAEGGAARQGYSYQRCKRDLESRSSHPPPSCSAAAYRWRSHQWGGRRRKPPRPSPAPEILDDGNLCCRGPLRPGSQGLGRGAGASASLAQPGAPSHRPGPGLALYSHLAGLTQLRPNWAGGLGSGVSRPRSRCPDGEMMNSRPGPKETRVPSASFPLSPWQLLEVGTGGSGSGSEKIRFWGSAVGRARKGAPLLGQHDWGWGGVSLLWDTLQGGGRRQGEGTGFRFPALGEQLAHPLMPRVPPSPSSHSSLAEERFKEAQAALPAMEAASPGAGRKLIMKLMMLIPSCISQLGTPARAAPGGLAPHPLPFPPACCPHPPPPRRPPRLLCSRRRRASLAFALLSPMELIPAPLVARPRSGRGRGWQRVPE